MNPTDFILSRAVFLSAESAAVDDFSQLNAEHLAAAIAYGDSQTILPSRSKKVLRLLKAVQAGRPQSFNPLGR